jgi:hypothetical protein
MNWSRRGVISFRLQRCRCGLRRAKGTMKYVAAAMLLAGIVGSLPGESVAQIGDHTLPTASRAGDLQLGGGLVFGNSNYNFNNTLLIGGSFYTTFDVRSHLGAEANFRQSNASSGASVYERTYEFGPRVYLDRGGVAPYAKVLYGRGVYNFPNGVANVAYNMYTFGGGMDFLVLPSLNIRADYEYQSWVGFPLGTLHPSVATIGVAFHFHE